MHPAHCSPSPPPAPLGLALPATASAHVTVRADDAAPGAWSKLAFRVPNESDTAGTVGLTVTFPTDTPFAFVSVKPHVGWDVEVARDSLDHRWRQAPPPWTRWSRRSPGPLRVTP